MKITFALLLFFTFTFLNAQENHYFGVIHVHSVYSSGKNNFRQLTALAKENNISFVIMTENFQLKWEYGLPYFRGILKKVVEMPSVTLFGIENFLKEIEVNNNRQKEVLFIPGVEVAPFYYWEEHLTQSMIKMWNFQKNLLFIGPEESEVYKKIPAASNSDSYFYTIKSLFFPSIALVFFIITIFSLVFLKMRTLSIFFSLPGILLLLMGYPFKEMPVSIYDGELKEKPYQNFINYANKNSALTIWTSPEAKDYSEHDYKIGKVIIQTNPHSELLLQTYDYTAFAAVYEDNITVTDPGNIWDQLLNDFVEGKRKKPIFGISDALYHYEGQANKYFKNIINGFWLKELKKDSILNAIKSGKFYAYRNNENFRATLKNFYAEFAGKKYFSGENAKLLKKPRFIFNFELQKKDSQAISIQMIINGKISETFSKIIPGRFSLEESTMPKHGKYYYRFRINISERDYILTNPIFIDYF